MKLQTYLSRYQRTATWLAGETGLSIGFITRLMPSDDGPPERRPSLDTIARIHRATDGQVTANDWLEDNDFLDLEYAAA